MAAAALGRAPLEELWASASGAVGGPAANESRVVALRVTRAVQFLIFGDDIEQKVEIERGAPSGVFDVFFSVRAEQIVGEGAESRHDVWVLADARGFLGESCVAQVMAAVLDAPMPTNPSVPYQERGV